MRCDYCGSQATPATDEDGVLVMEPTSHLCPVCQKPLSKALIDGRDLLYCASCHGMLFEMDGFVAVLEVLRERRYWSGSSQSRRNSDPSRVLHCPLCNAEMDRHPYGGGGNVEVDSCESSNVLWLDRGELSRITAAPDRDPAVEFAFYQDTSASGGVPHAGVRATVESAAPPPRKHWPII